MASTLEGIVLWSRSGTGTSFEGRELEARYGALQDLIELARRGDETAYARLEALSENAARVAPVSETGTDE